MHPSSINCHRKQNSQKNKGPGSLTDTENKTHKKKKKKKTKVQETTRTDRQTNKHVALIYKIVTHVTLC
jgi:hypothetical protein